MIKFLTILTAIASPLLSLEHAFAQSEVRPNCCIAVYDASDPVLYQQAMSWLNEHPNCEIHQSYTREEFSFETLEAAKVSCGEVFVLNAEHGPICNQVVNYAEVCSSVYSDCNVSLESTSCQSFADFKAAQSAIEQSKLAALSRGRKISITGMQTNYSIYMPACKNTVTFDIADRALTCLPGPCAEEGALCGPLGPQAQCLYKNRLATQQCCPTAGVGAFEDPPKGEFSAPNRACKNVTNACLEPDRALSADMRSIKFGAEPCSGDLENVSPGTRISVVKKCGSAKCEYKCANGYEFDSIKACKPIYACLGLSKPANAVPCLGSGLKLTAHRSYRVVDACPSEPFDNCDYSCKQNYRRDGWRCVPDFVCVGSTPGNSKLCIGDDKNLSMNTVKKAVLPGACSAATQCEYECKPGYVPQNGTCIKPKCTGSKPKRGKLCVGTDQGLSADTQIYFTGLTQCTNAYQCEYRCPEGYSPDFVEYSCNKIGYWTPPPPKPETPKKNHK